ncbi:MAG: extracellular solute-binding protein [Clostridiales bacterium]|nr:extracellular solute-binding protein [Clostridiales bacterium]
MRRLLFITALFLLLTTHAAYAGEVSTAVGMSYTEYLSVNGPPVSADKNAAPVVIPASAWASQTGAEISGEYVLADENTELHYNAEIPAAGWYTLSIRYAAVVGGSQIVRRVLLDGAVPFAECGDIQLRRYYQDAHKSYKTQQGNQDFPPQVEVERWTEAALVSTDGYHTEPFAFYLTAGAHTLSIVSEDASVLMETLTLTPYAALPTYAEYDGENRAKGYAEINGEPLKIQAEDATFKSAPSLYPINDRTSPKTEPYHPTYVTLNTIGGTTWRDPGTLAEWEVTVPREGLYAIALKTKQAVTRGAFSTRSLRVNGEVPFKEAQDLRFEYNTNFQLDYLSDSEGEPYLFYLREGVNALSLEATLGVFSSLTERVGELLKRNNRIYQDVAVFTGATPDKYRDYNLYTLIPDLRQRLVYERDQVREIMAEINSIGKSYAGSTAILNRFETTLTRVIDNPDKLTSYFVDLKSCISALGDWMVQVLQQPLQIDYLIVSPKDYKLPPASGNFFENAVHTLRAFLGSFTNDFDNERAVAGADAKTIEVWVSTGRDQYTVLNRLISESFAREHHINVNLRLINADAIIPATITGIGPDVNIQLASGTPVNFGLRNGAADLTRFADFAQVAERFSPAAIDTFSFDGACYALPDQMSFNVMFYRTDILESLGLEAPATMDELLAMVPILSKNTMEIYFSTAAQPNVQTSTGTTAASGQESLGATGSTSAKNFNSTFASILFQHGGQVYSDDGSVTLMNSPEGVQAFKFWTELYTKHTFVVTTDFVTRFRLGEVPIGVIDFSTFNRLSVGAPEIRGDWRMVPVPGIARADGSTRKDVSLNVSGAMIVDQTARRHGVLDASWEFLKWWTSADTQYSYAVQMESILGLAGRYPVANLEAFQRIGWGKDNLAVLNEGLTWARAVPQVPGSYITGRAIDNAFVSVITEDENVNPADALYKACEEINTELDIKRKEFGISDGR